jgi:hypothetical protein
VRAGPDRIRSVADPRVTVESSSFATELLGRAAAAPPAACRRVGHISGSSPSATISPSAAIRRVGKPALPEADGLLNSCDSSSFETGRGGAGRRFEPAAISLACTTRQRHVAIVAPVLQLRAA